MRPGHVEMVQMVQAEAAMKRMTAPQSIKDLVKDGDDLRSEAEMIDV